jgi:hypothetical protein
MDNKEVIEKIEETLKKMGCADVSLVEVDENMIIATFNCDHITSFVENMSEWIYSGIQLDTTKEKQYKIIFTKSVTIP